MLLHDRNLPPPGSPPPKTAAELVDAIQRFGILATDARHAEIARLFQGMAVVASMSDAALAQRNRELEQRVAELERSLAALTTRDGGIRPTDVDLIVDGVPESHA